MQQTPLQSQQVFRNTTPMNTSASVMGTPVDGKINLDGNGKTANITPGSQGLPRTPRTSQSQSQATEQDLISVGNAYIQRCKGITDGYRNTAKLLVVFLLLSGLSMWVEDEVPSLCFACLSLVVILWVFGILGCVCWDLYVVHSLETKKKLGSLSSKQRTLLGLGPFTVFNSNLNPPSPSSSSLSTNPNYPKYRTNTKTSHSGTPSGASGGYMSSSSGRKPPVMRTPLSASGALYPTYSSSAESKHHFHSGSATAGSSGGSLHHRRSTRGDSFTGGVSPVPAPQWNASNTSVSNLNLGAGGIYHSPVPSTGGGSYSLRNDTYNSGNSAGIRERLVDDNESTSIDRILEDYKEELALAASSMDASYYANTQGLPGGNLGGTPTRMQHFSPPMFYHASPREEVASGRNVKLDIISVDGDVQDGPRQLMHLNLDTKINDLTDSMRKFLGRNTVEQWKKFKIVVKELASLNISEDLLLHRIEKQASFQEPIPQTAQQPQQSAFGTGGLSSFLSYQQQPPKAQTFHNASLDQILTQCRNNSCFTKDGTNLVDEYKTLERMFEVKNSYNYCIKRVEELCEDSLLGNYTWNGGSYLWKAEMIPCDAEIIMNIFCCYCDSMLSRQRNDDKPFTRRHFMQYSKWPHGRTLKGRNLILQCIAYPPHFRVIANGEMWPVYPEKNNCFQAIILFLHSMKNQRSALNDIVNEVFASGSDSDMYDFYD